MLPFPSLLSAQTFPPCLSAIDLTSGSELTIKITGYQWQWHYEYLGTSVSYFSRLARTSDLARQKGSGIDPGTVENYLLEVDHPLVVPTRTRIRILLTANDVMPRLVGAGLRHEARRDPGVHERDVDLGGRGQARTYRGQCAELCVADHGFMPIVVVAMPRAEFDAWLAEQEAAAQTAHAATE